LQSNEVSLSQSPIRAVLYDFDGTLADTTELVMNCYRHTMQTHLGHTPPDEEWLRGFGTPLEGQLARFARNAEERAAMLKTYEDFQAEHTNRLMVPFPGALETVAALKESGLPLAIVTSRYRESTILGMDVCGITRFFDLIVAPEDVRNPKPHPEPVLFALDRLGVPATEALFVGDSPHDMASGRAAGVRTAAALWGPFPLPRLEAEHPDFLLERQEDVLDLVG
jgi:pyrophosphatase PpaX